MATAAVTLVTDAPGRVLAIIAAAGLSRLQPFLACTAKAGNQRRRSINSRLVTRTRAATRDIKIIRITEFRRIARKVRLLEVDTVDDRLLVFTRWDLGTDPLEVSTRLLLPASRPPLAPSSGDGDRLDHHRLGRPVTAVGGGGGDGVDDLLRLGVDDLAEDGVLAVQVRRLADGDEELRAVGARAPRWPSPAGRACRTAAPGGTRRRTRIPGHRGRCRSGHRPGS